MLSAVFICQINTCVNKDTHTNKVMNVSMSYSSICIGILRVICISSMTSIVCAYICLGGGRLQLWRRVASHVVARQMRNF